MLSRWVTYYVHVQEIKPINLKGNGLWILTGKADAETPAFWSPDVNSWLIGEILNSGKDWGHKEKRMRWLNGIKYTVDMNWADFGRWWGTGRPGMLQSMGSQRARHNWATEQWGVRIFWKLYLYKLALACINSSFPVFWCNVFKYIYHIRTTFSVDVRTAPYNQIYYYFCTETYNNTYLVR